MKRPERPSGRKPRPKGIISADVEKHYDIGGVIGDGNFATVKECRHRETKQAYAMKMIDKSQLKGKEDIVDSEILIIQSLSHPNIVKLHEVYETEAEIYLIMEYVQGGDLFDAIVENVKFPEPEAAVMITDLCKAGVILYILLCGFPPFRSPERDQDELFNIIQVGQFEFLSPYWDNISDAAKDLVRNLLEVDPKKRYTAEQVLQHPWIEMVGHTNTGNSQKEESPNS